MTYRLIPDNEAWTGAVGIIRVSDGAFIPEDERNRDWREYQEWLAQGNTPDPA